MFQELFKGQTCQDQSINHQKLCGHVKGYLLSTPWTGFNSQAIWHMPRLLTCCNDRFLYEINSDLVCFCQKIMAISNDQNSCNSLVRESPFFSLLRCFIAWAQQRRFFDDTQIREGFQIFSFWPQREIYFLGHLFWEKWNLRHSCFKQHFFSILNKCYTCKRSYMCLKCDIFTVRQQSFEEIVNKTLITQSAGFSREWPRSIIRAWKLSRADRSTQLTREWMTIK